jgi:HEAT repeat protein
VVLQAISELAGDRTRLVEPLRGVVLPAEAAERLQQLAKEGGSEAGVAALLLGEMGAKTAVPVLLALLDDQEAVARRDVLHALGRLGDPRAGDAIARDLYSDSAEVRSAAARALAQLKVPSQVEAIDALKGDYDLQVRNSATAALDALAPSAPEGKR